MAMTPPSYWPDSAIPAVLDASAVINLNGTGMAELILKALACDLIVAVDVVEELADGIGNGRRDAELLGKLIGAGLVRAAPFGQDGMDLFERLTVGPSRETLDDGEAATIALASELGAAAVIDERKGRRLCGETAPHVRIVSSVDIFIHPGVQAALGEKLGDALFGALSTARMHVLPQYHAWVVGLLGPERSMLCKSLPRSVRG